MYNAKKKKKTSQKARRIARAADVVRVPDATLRCQNRTGRRVGRSKSGARCRRLGGAESGAAAADDATRIRRRVQVRDAEEGKEDRTCGGAGEEGAVDCGAGDEKKNRTQVNGTTIMGG